MARKAHFSGPITTFHGRGLPEKAIPAGYGALIDAYFLQLASDTRSKQKMAGGSSLQGTHHPLILKGILLSLLSMKGWTLPF